MYTLRDIEIGDYVRTREGKEFKVLDIYNRGTAAHQLLLEHEYYPMLLTEMVKLGFMYGRSGQ